MELKKFVTKKTLIGLALGQFVSLLITSTSLSSSELSRRGFNAPTSQSFFNYALLAAVYGSVMLYRRRSVQIKWWYYLLLGLVDVEANFLVVKAYQYSSLTSIMLLDCWVIPCVLFLTWLFLNTRYKFRQLIGVAICIAGMVTVVFSDVFGGDLAGGSNPLKGDLFVIAASMLYAISNVSQEFIVKNGGRVELMSMLGLFGAIISACQVAILERKELENVKWSTGSVLPFVGFSLALFLFYSTVPTLLKVTGAAMLNLSLLTSDMWAVLIRTFAYDEMVDWLYFVAFAGVVVGLVIYSIPTKEELESERQIAVQDDAQSRSSNHDLKDKDEKVDIEGYSPQDHTSTSSSVDPKRSLMNERMNERGLVRKF